MAREETGRSALDSQRGGVAILDQDGNVISTDESWSTDDEGGLPRVPVGVNLVQTYRGSPDSRVQAVANAIVAVVEGRATYFEIEHRVSRESQGSFVTSVAPLRGDGAGAVLIHKFIGGRADGTQPQPVGSRRVGSWLVPGFDRMTPREREVLDLMAVGLDNRAIAVRLNIQYSTVRGHVRSVIEKLGARSRLEAVARAYQFGLVPG